MLQNVTSTSAVLVWETRPATNGHVEYFSLPAAPKKAVHAIVSSHPSTRHEVFIKNLKPASAYSYRVNFGEHKRPVWRGGVFRTAPLADSTSPIRFAVWGDSGSGEPGQKQLAGQIEKFKPDLMVHTGDLIYPVGAVADYDRKFYQPYANLLKNAPFYGSLGNHDILTQHGKPFTDNFVLPSNGPKALGAEHNYSFTWGDIQFWVLDTNISYGQMKNTQATWLEAGLKRSKSTWKVVVFHQPPFSSGFHGGWERTRDVLAPVLVRNGVDLVLNGHDHDYERFAPKNRTTFVVTGTGGAERYPRLRHESGSVAWNNQNFSFSAFEVRGKTLIARQIAANGKVLDSWSLRK